MLCPHPNGVGLGGRQATHKGKTTLAGWHSFDSSFVLVVLLQLAPEVKQLKLMSVSLVEHWVPQHISKPKLFERDSFPTVFAPPRHALHVGEQRKFNKVVSLAALARILPAKHAPVVQPVEDEVVQCLEHGTLPSPWHQPWLRRTPPRCTTWQPKGYP